MTDASVSGIRGGMHSFPQPCLIGRRVISVGGALHICEGFASTGTHLLPAVTHGFLQQLNCGLQGHLSGLLAHHHRHLQQQAACWRPGESQRQLLHPGQPAARRA